MAHPVRCFTEPVRLSTPLEAHEFGLTYIKASAEPRDTASGAAFWEAGRRAQASPRWRYYEIDTNHMVASNRPHELADLLTDIADMR